MGQIHALQRRVEVAQQGFALFEEETRGTGARLIDAFGRIEDVLREKDFQLVRRELEVQRLARENAQARMLLETLLETVEQRKLPSLREVIEQFERKLAASTALGGDAPPATSGPDVPAAAPPPVAAEAQPAMASDPEPSAPESSNLEAAEPAALTLAEFMAAEAVARPMAAEPVGLAPPPAVVAVVEPASAPSPPPLAAFADPAGDATVTIPVAAEADRADDEDELHEPQAEFLPPAAGVRARAFDPNEELIAEARVQLRSRKGGARLIEEEQRRYAYKVWLGPILIGVGALGPLALVLARIAH